MSDEHNDGEGEIGLTPKEAAILVGEHQGALAKARFKIETERDRAILIITGGALTVSFAYVPTLFDKGTVVHIGYLILAWVAWVITLVWMLVNYSISIAAYGKQIKKLSDGRWQEAQQEPWIAKHIEKFNNLTILIMVIGFAFFGYFEISNLEKAPNAAQKAVTASRRADSRKKEVDAGRKERRAAENPQAQKEVDTARKVAPADGVQEGAGNQRALAPTTTETPAPAKEKTPDR